MVLQRRSLPRLRPCDAASPRPNREKREVCCRLRVLQSGYGSPSPNVPTNIGFTPTASSEHSGKSASVVAASHHLFVLVSNTACTQDVATVTTF